MKLNILTADPAGNVTILVRTAVEAAQYSAVAGRLLALSDRAAEQVGFFTAPRFGGDVRLEMMGGEFCGNALRSAGLAFAAAEGKREPTRVLVEISGCAAPLEVTADPASGETSAQMPLPLGLKRLSLLGRTLEAVVFEGIAHVIFPGDAEPLPPAAVESALRAATEELGASAAGLLFLDEAAERLCPAVYVRDTDSLYYENSCASGSAAAAVWCALRRGDGTHTLALRQKGGVIRTFAEVKNGAVTALRIGGAVRLGAEEEITLCTEGRIGR